MRHNKRARSQDKEQNLAPRFKCDEPGCNKSFPREFNLLRHLATHADVGHKLMFACPECESTFTTQFALERHSDTHLAHDADMKVTQFPCPECARNCSSAFNMERHIKRAHAHDNDRDWVPDGLGIRVRSQARRNTQHNDTDSDVDVDLGSGSESVTSDSDDTGIYTGSETEAQTDRDRLAEAKLNEEYRRWEEQYTADVEAFPFKAHSGESLVTECDMERMVNGYLADTSATGMASAVCCVCSEVHEENENTVNCYPLTSCLGWLEVLGQSSTPARYRHPHPQISGVPLDYEGLVATDPEAGEYSLLVCLECETYLSGRRGKRGKVKQPLVPPAAIANWNDYGVLPEHVRDCTLVERMSAAAAKTSVQLVTLTTHGAGPPGSGQKAIIGNAVTYPSNWRALGKAMQNCPLPSAPIDIVNDLSIVFVGNQFPARHQLKSIFGLRRDKVMALMTEYRKQGHPTYTNFNVSHPLVASAFDKLPHEGIPDELWDNIVLSPLDPSLVAGEHASYTNESPFDNTQANMGDADEIVPVPSSLQDVYDVNTGVEDALAIVASRLVTNRVSNDGGVFRKLPINQMNLQAALQKQCTVIATDVEGLQRPAVLQPTRSQPRNEYEYEFFFADTWPHLTPSGQGDPCSKHELRRTNLTWERFVHHCLRIRDHRFREDSAFMLIVENILHTRRIHFQTALQLKNKDSIQSMITSVTKEDMNVCLQILKQKTSKHKDGEPIASVHMPPERKACMARVKQLVAQINCVARKVQYTDAEKQSFLYEMEGLCILYGTPPWFFTLNPNDLINPLVLHFAGKKIDLDNPSLNVGGLSVGDSSKVPAKNPTAACLHFHKVCTSFIKHVLCVDLQTGDRSPVRPPHERYGAFGVLDALHSGIESQGKGTLHLHALFWSRCPTGKAFSDKMEQSRREGTPFKETVLAFLEKTIEQHLTPRTMNKLAREKPIARNIPEDIAEYNRSMSLGTCNCCCQSSSSSHDLDLDMPADAVDNFAEIARDTSSGRNWRVDAVDMEEYLYYMATDGQVQAPVDDHEGFGPGAKTFTRPSIAVLRKRFVPRLPGESVRSFVSRLECFSDEVAHRCQIHYHTKTCYKYNNIECRFGFARTIVPDSIVTERGEIILRRHDCWLCNFNRVVAATAQCNHDVRFLGNAKDAKSARHYACMEYTAKGELNSHNIIPMLAEQFSRIDAWKSTVSGSDGAEKQARKVLNSCLMKLTTSTERSGQHCASSALGKPSHYTNKKFVLLFVDTYLNAMSALLDINSNTTGPDIDGRWFVHAPAAHGLESGLTFSSQAADYLFRPPAADNVGLHPFLSRYSIRKRSKHTLQRHLFLDGHHKQASHVAKLCSVTNLKVPVLVGSPGNARIPHSGRHPEAFAKYMLILFKPFRGGQAFRSILNGFSSAQDAFRDWLHTASNEEKRWVQNCEDLGTASSSDLRTERQILQSLRSLQADSQAACADGCDEKMHSSEVGEVASLSLDDLDLLFEEAAPDNTDAMHTLEDESLSALKLPSANTGSDAAICAATYALNLCSQDINKPQVDARKRTLHANINSFEFCRKLDGDLAINHISWKKHLRNKTKLVRDHDHGLLKSTGDFHANTNLDQPSAWISLEKMAKHYKLNTKQRTAFVLFGNNFRQRLLFEERAVGSQPDPFHLVVLGPGGTGKSVVLRAMVALAESHGKRNWIKVTAYTGVAANNAGGSTLSSTLADGKGSRGMGKSSNKTSISSAVPRNQLKGLSKNLAQARYIFVDEFSMLSLQLIDKMDTRAKQAKALPDLPFGGLSTVLFGDLYQLPPVGGCAIYSTIQQINADTQMSLASKASAIRGLNLWFVRLSTLVVELTQQMRQNADTRFLELLTRVRDGYENASESQLKSDYELLKDLIVSSEGIQTQRQSFSQADVLVTGNPSRESINIVAVRNSARTQSEPLLISIARDQFQHEQVRGGLTRRNQRILFHLNSSATNHMPGMLPLLQGFAYHLKVNMGTEIGLCNGTPMRLRSVILHKDEPLVPDERTKVHNLKFLPQYLLFDVPNPQFAPFPGLPHGVFPLEPTTDSFERDSSNLKFGKRKGAPKESVVRVVRSHFKCVLAKCLTSHGCQGLTLDKAIVDLTCDGTRPQNFAASLYVMLSRVRSSKDLAILRPFDINVLRTQRCQNLRQEMERLRRIAITPDPDRKV